MKVLVVDDEKPARQRLMRLIANLPQHECVAEAENGQQALLMADRYQPDVVLLDIRMPGMDGIEAAHHFAAQADPPAVIFTTAFSDHALEAFEAHAVDYLLKPVKIERLAEALDNSARLNRAQLGDHLGEIENESVRQHICARIRGNLVLVSLEDIYYFRAEQKYITVRHAGGELLIEEPLKALEQEFSQEFHRVHRNGLVRIDKIAGMQNKAGQHLVFFQDIEDRLEVSRRHLSGVRNILKKL
jgi:two-component system response regulator AlgR